MASRGIVSSVVGGATGDMLGTGGGLLREEMPRYRWSAVRKAQRVFYKILQDVLTNNGNLHGLLYCTVPFFPFRFD